MNGDIGVRVLNAVAAICIGLLGLALAFLPHLVGMYSDTNGLLPSGAVQLTTFLYLTAVPFGVILFMTRRLCKCVMSGEPFSQKSLAFLMVISVCGFTDFLLYFAGTLLVFRDLLSLTLMVSAFMVGLVGLVLHQLTGAAIEMQLDNKLTI